MKVARPATGELRRPGRSNKGETHRLRFAERGRRVSPLILQDRALSVTWHRRRSHFINLRNYVLNDQSVSLTPAAIAGDARSDLWMRQKL
jgi:hypothetical protein